MAEPGEVTRLLRAYEAGDAEAFNRLVPLVYGELRRVARGQLRRGPGWPSLDSAGLVHETYLKLAAADGLSMADRAHLMAVAASAMRQVLIDRARGRLRAKRGGVRPRSWTARARPSSRRPSGCSTWTGRSPRCGSATSGWCACSNAASSPA